jgi:hypothetical protein
MASVFAPLPVGLFSFSAARECGATTGGVDVAAICRGSFGARRGEENAFLESLPHAMNFNQETLAQRQTK